MTTVNDTRITDCAAVVAAEVTRHVGPKTTLDHVLYQATPRPGRRPRLMDVLDDETSSIACRELVVSALMKVRRYCSEFAHGARTVRQVNAAWRDAEEALYFWEDYEEHPIPSGLDCILPAVISDLYSERQGEPGG